VISCHGANKSSYFCLTSHHIALNTRFPGEQLREAREEIGLPTTSPHLHILGLLPPSISLHRLVVVPVVALVSDISILRDLKASEEEVAQIFSHPLEAILSPTLAETEKLVEKGTEDWIYPDDLYVSPLYTSSIFSDSFLCQNTSDSYVPVLANTQYRMHRFRTSASPIKGLTADFLVSHVTTLLALRSSRLPS